MIYKTIADGNLFKELRKKIGLSQIEVAKILNIQSSAVSKWERNKSIPDQGILPEVAKLYNTTTDYLLTGKDNIKSKTTGIKIPVLGSIPAGIPIEAIEDIIDWEEITPDMALNGEYFGLKVKGNSMTPRICNGDVVIVKKQEDVESGDIVIVYINDYEATLKQIKFDEHGLYLIPINPAYKTQFFSKKEVISLPIKICGKVVELRAKF